MERRAAERKTFNEPVEFELIAIESGACRRAVCDALGLNINSQGLGLLTSCPLVMGMVLRLAVPARGNAAVPVFAEVAWSDPIDGSFHAGVRFLQ